MPKKPRLSLRDLEQEDEKFLAPTTEKEKAILRAAVELLGERGVDGATTAELARRARVTERTLFRYFPSKDNLIKRVLFPLILRRALTRQWGTVEALLKTKGSNLKAWYMAATTEELAAVAKNPGLARTVLIELLRNDELRTSIGQLWQQHIWRPMIESLAELQANGTIRKDVDLEVLARAVHCLHVGYFLTRHVFAPANKWDDSSEIDKMAEIIAHGASEERPNSEG